MPKCDECGREFSTDAALAQHLKDKHGQAPPSNGRQRDSAANQPRAARKERTRRRRNRHPLLIALVVVALVAGLGLYLVVGPELQPAPFSCTTGESWIHMHPYLIIDIEGTNITIPQGVGILQGGTCTEPVHTHDRSGLLHVELSQADSQAHNYTLGDFFNIWAYTARTSPSVVPSLTGPPLPVEFSSTDILGFKTNSTYQVTLLVDGKASTAGPSLNLEQLDYCSTANTGLPCCPTDCTSSTGPAADPLWDGTSNYPYGYGHTIVIEYTRV
jgi:hypothetical protein